MQARDDVARLESAILARASNLAEEYARQARLGRQRVMATSTDKLRLVEERETLTAKAHADREYRRLVQAWEIQTRAELDRVRWALVQSVMQGVRDRLSALAADDAAYLEVFVALLGEAAAAIDSPTMVAEINVVDYQRYAQSWTDLVAKSVPGKTIELLEPYRPFIGGVCVLDADRSIRVDNSFEGRIERLGDALYEVIFERLFVSLAPLGGHGNGG